MTNEIQQIDPRLTILMQWLKDNDESGLSKREHANRNSTWVPADIKIPKHDCS